MGTTASVALHLAILMYLVAAVIAVAALLRAPRARAGIADGMGAVATLSLLVFFAARFVEAGSEPFSSLFEVVTMAALFLAVAYFAATRVKPMPALGAFAFPAICIIFVVNLLFAGDTVGTEGSGRTTPLLVVHVVLTLLSYAVFFMAAVAAMMFLLQERALKRHRDPAIIRGFPPLERLRRVVNACIWISLPMLTVAFALGFAAMDSPGWESIARNPKVVASLVLWIVLLVVAVGSKLGWLHGRKHFHMVLVGFGLVVLTFIGLGIWARSQTLTAQTGTACVSGRPMLVDAQARAGASESVRSKHKGTQPRAYARGSCSAV